MFVCARLCVYVCVCVCVCVCVVLRGKSQSNCSGERVFCCKAFYLLGEGIRGGCVHLHVHVHVFECVCFFLVWVCWYQETSSGLKCKLAL